MAERMCRLTVGAAVAAVALFLFCGEESRLAEEITTGIGAVCREANAAFFGRIPFSVAALLLFAIPAIPLVIGLAFCFFKPKTVLRTAFTMLCGLILSFMLMFGFGYRREKISSLLPTERVDIAVCASLLSKMTDVLAEPVGFGEREELLSLAEDEFSGGRVKAIRQDSPYLALGILGFYSPFTGEVSVAESLPLPTAVFTAAHELAHAEGYAREEEADYVAFCRLWESGNPALRYAAAFAMYPAVAAAVASKNSALCASIMNRLPHSASDSLYAAERDLRGAEQTEIKSAAEAVADAALSPLGGSTADYGKAVVLLAARYGLPQ